MNIIEQYSDLQDSAAEGRPVTAPCFLVMYVLSKNYRLRRAAPVFRDAEFMKRKELSDYVKFVFPEHAGTIIADLA